MMMAGLSMVRDGLIDPDHYLRHHQLDGVNSKGEVCGVTTTSGLAWKIPGRVGDSPILGAGLYVDGEVGAAGSTGRGEANLYNLCSFLIVEEMRRGKHPKDAGLEACRRVQKNTVEKRLLNARGLPNFGLNFYILNNKGEYAGVSMYTGDLRGVHREGAGDGADDGAARRTRHRLIAGAPQLTLSGLRLTAYGLRLSAFRFRLSNERPRKPWPRKHERTRKHEKELRAFASFASFVTLRAFVPTVSGWSRSRPCGR